MMIKGECLRYSPLTHDYKTDCVNITKILVPKSAQNFLCLAFQDYIRENFFKA